MNYPHIMNRLGWNKTTLGILVAFFIVAGGLYYVWTIAAHRSNDVSQVPVQNSAQNSASDVSSGVNQTSEQNANTDQFGPMVTSGTWGFRSIKRVDQSQSKPDDPYNEFIGIYRDGKEVKELPLDDSSDSRGAANLFSVSPDESQVSYVETYTEGGCIYGEVAHVLDLNSLTPVTIVSSNASAIAKTLGLNQDPTWKTNGFPTSVYDIRAYQKVDALKWLSPSQLEVTVTFGGPDGLCPLSTFSTRKNVPDQVQEKLLYTVSQ